MRRQMTVGIFVAAGLAVAVALAVFASPFASSKPDGLEKVASDKAIDGGVEDHAFAGGPLADYSVEGVDSTKVSAGVAGLIGVTVTFAAAAALFVVLKRVRRTDRPVSAAAPAGP